jgi:hypothetical protein
MRTLLTLALLAGWAAAAPVPKALKAKLEDKTALVGTWKVTLLNGNGGNIHTHTYTFEEGGKVKVLCGANVPGGEWFWSIEPDQTPKRMKWVSVEGMGGFDCVYELTGDTFKLGFLTTGQKTAAAVAPGLGVTLYEMTRDTATK